MKTRKEFSNLVIVFCFTTLIIPLFTSTLFILTIVKLLDHEKMKFIQNMIGDYGRSGLIIFAIIFFLLSIILFVFSSLIIKGGFAYKRRMKRSSNRNRIVETRTKRVNKLFLFSNILEIISGILLVVFCKDNQNHYSWGNYVFFTSFIIGAIIPLFSFDHLLSSGEEPDLNRRTEKILGGMLLNIVIYIIAWRLTYYVFNHM